MIRVTIPGNASYVTYKTLLDTFHAWKVLFFSLEKVCSVHINV